MARAATIADAAVYAGTIAAAIDATSAPTTTQATYMWDDAAGAANAALLAAGLSITQTAGTVAYLQALEIERRRTSAAVLRFRQPLPAANQGHPAEVHEQIADRIASEMREQAQAWIGAGQATPLSTEAATGWSYLVDGLRGSPDLTPGAGTVPYATPRPPKAGSW